MKKRERLSVVYIIILVLKWAICDFKLIFLVKDRENNFVFVFIFNRRQSLFKIQKCQKSNAMTWSPIKAIQ